MELRLEALAIGFHCSSYTALREHIAGGLPRSASCKSCTRAALVPYEDGPPAGHELEANLETLVTIDEDATIGNEEEEGRAEEQVEGGVRGHDDILPANTALT